MKLLFFDVDGTLMNEERVIPASALQALSAAKEAGNLVFVNSGRTSGMLQGVMSAVPADGFLCGCGTELLYQGQQLYYHALPDTLKQRVMAASDRYGVVVFLEGKNGWHCQPSSTLLEEHPTLRAAYDRVLHYVGNEGGIDTTPYAGEYEISKFCIQADESSDMSGFQRDFATDFTVIDRRDGFYECVPKNHSKGIAVDRILAHFGIGKEDAYAFGDSTNDLEMFLHCGHTIAMGAHDPALDPYTEYVTAEVDQDGIAKAVAHFGLDK